VQKCGIRFVDVLNSILGSGDRAPTEEQIQLFKFIPFPCASPVWKTWS